MQCNNNAVVHPNRNMRCVSTHVAISIGKDVVHNNPTYLETLVINE